MLIENIVTICSMLKLHVSDIYLKILENIYRTEMVEYLVNVKSIAIELCDKLMKISQLGLGLCL